MIGLALSLLAVQNVGPEVSATADRQQLMVGEELVYTVRAVSRSDEAMRLHVASVSGFEIVARTERREVSFTPVTRSSILELRLRALRAGTFELGPVEAHQGGEIVSIPGVSIEVSESRGAVAAAVNPRVAGLLRRARPPALADEVGLTVHLSADTVLVGQQIDVVTAAWFPRDLRLRLRRPPTLQPPSVDGLWSYPQPAPVGIAASRRVDGEWYDLFVSHEIVFPLTAGTFVLDPANLRYSVPLALQFFSQEERLSLESATPVIEVEPLPTEGQPDGFRGAVGTDLSVAWRVPRGSGRVGDPFEVEFTIEGLGNVSLWPDPEPVWSSEVRVYRDQVEERHQSERGHIRGSKTFSYLVVPSEPGPLTVPEVEYSYYDLATGGFRTLEVAPVVVPVAPGDGSLTARALPPPLLEDGQPPWWYRLGAIPRVVWLVLWIAPPLLFFLGRLLPRRPRRRAGRRMPSDLRTAEREFERLIRLYVPDLEEHVGSALLSALTVAGLDHATAEQVGSLRQRLMEARYGPDGELYSHAALVVEIRAIVQHLATIPQATLRHRTVVAGFIILLLSAGPSWSQEASPHEMYQAGALRMAAEGFEHAAAAEPGVAAHWYNLGATQYRLGNDWEAAAAWHRALALSPRSRHVARALALVPPPDRGSVRVLAIPPVAAEELWLLALVAWLTAWTGLALGRARRRWLILMVLAGVLAGSATGVSWWLGRSRGIILTESPLRVSPHERAPEITLSPAGTALWLGRTRGGWVLAQEPNGAEGWLPQRVIATP